MKSTNKSNSPPKQGGVTKSSGAMGQTGSQLAASLKQKQVSPNSELLRSFKATTSLAAGLTKERFKI